MATEESVTITETAPDGTETTIEITTTKADDSIDGESLVEEVVEALFDVEIPDDNTENVEELNAEEIDLTDYQTEGEQVDFTEGSEMPVSSDTSQTSAEETSFEPIIPTADPLQDVSEQIEQEEYELDMERDHQEYVDQQNLQVEEHYEQVELEATEAEADNAEVFQAEEDFADFEGDDSTFDRGDYTDIGTGSDGDTSYVIGEDFSYID